MLFRSFRLLEPLGRGGFVDFREHVSRLHLGIIVDEHFLDLAGDLRADVDGDRLTFGWRAGGDPDWRILPDVHDASILSDEVTLPRLPNFTGAFVGVACSDLSGAGHHADFDWFEYRERAFVPDPRNT